MRSAAILIFITVSNLNFCQTGQNYLTIKQMENAADCSTPASFDSFATKLGFTFYGQENLDDGAKDGLCSWHYGKSVVPEENCEYFLNLQYITWGDRKMVVFSTFSPIFPYLIKNIESEAITAGYILTRKSGVITTGEDKSYESSSYILDSSEEHSTDKGQYTSYRIGLRRK